MGSEGLPWPSQGCGHSPCEEQGYCSLHEKIGLQPTFPALSAFSPPSCSGTFFFFSPTIALSTASGQKPFGICFNSLLLGTINELKIKSLNSAFI